MAALVEVARERGLLVRGERDPGAADEHQRRVPGDLALSGEVQVRRRVPLALERARELGDRAARVRLGPERPLAVAGEHVELPPLVVAEPEQRLGEGLLGEDVDVGVPLALGEHHPALAGLEAELRGEERILRPGP